MLEQLVITLREGVEAALIVAIALAYLRKIGRSDLARTVYIALGAAVAVSLAGAIALSLIHADEDRFEGWLMLLAAVFVATMVYWMHRAARSMRQDIERQVSAHTSATGLFLFIFFMVLREGVETVLMLSAVSMSTPELLAWLGGILGLILAVLFAVAFVRGSMRIHLPRFFRITTAILIVISAQLLITGVHELSEGGVLPSSRTEMAWIGPMVNNDVFFFVLILGLAGMLLLHGQVSATEAGDSAAEQRKKLAAARTVQRWRTLAASGAFMFLLLICADYVYARTARALDPPTSVAAVDGWVNLPIATIGDGSLHRFQVDTPSGPVRIFAIRKPSGELAVAVDACMICGPRGYRQQGNQLICLNCGAPINIASLGVMGGCNPITLHAEHRGDSLVLPVATLAAQAGMFHP